MNLFNDSGPHFVMILTRQYAVLVNNDMDEWGRTNNVRALIEINAKKCETVEILKRVICHEIGHAFAWESGLSNFMVTSTEEMFVENLSALLVNLPHSLWELK